MSPFQDPVHNDYAAQNLHGAHGYADTAYHAHQPAPYHSEASQNDYYHHQTHQAGYWPNDPHQSDLGQQNPLQSEFHDKAHHGASHRASDPFTDQNAIPLQPQTHPSSVPQNAKHLDKKKKKKLPVPWVVYTLTVVQIIVFIAELGVNTSLTHTPFAFKPTVNFMLGPSSFVLVNMGARYPPCMHNIEGVTDYPQPIQWPCPNSTSTNYSCGLSQLCGFGGVPDQAPGTNFNDRGHAPNQWFRFITPIFLHAGIIHIAFNMILQLTLGKDVERRFGSIAFTIVYFCSGIFGFVLGGNYAAPGIASSGASGCLFGILALNLLDLLYSWKTRVNPLRELLFIGIDVGFSFVLGLLPGLDNFSHIGGFLMGLVIGVFVIDSPTALSLRRRFNIGKKKAKPSSFEPSVEEQPLNGISAKQGAGAKTQRKTLWCAWWTIRILCLVAVFIGFILLLKNFYVWRHTCDWCHNLSCLPVKNWCDIGNLKPTQTSAPTSAATKRSFAAVNPRLVPTTAPTTSL